LFVLGFNVSNIISVILQRSTF